MGRIVVNVDGSAVPCHALAWATSEARLGRASLDVRRAECPVVVIRDAGQDHRGEQGAGEA